MKWAVGITTCAARQTTLLPETVRSVTDAGFSVDRIFSDGGLKRLTPYPDVVTLRNPPIGTVGNWLLGAWELYLRFSADRYVMFQDDVACVGGMREYLERNPWPTNGYANLYCEPRNERHCERDGWNRSNQLGYGALALGFTRDALEHLLTATHLIKKRRSRKPHGNLDGTVVTSMRNAKYDEYVHYPSLVQHTGEKSTMGHKPLAVSESFPGESFDAREWL